MCPHCIQYPPISYFVAILITKLTVTIAWLWLKHSFCSSLVTNQKLVEPAAAPSSVTVFVKPSGRDPKEAFALVSVAALGLKDETLYGTLLVTSADSLLSFFSLPSTLFQSRPLFFLLWPPLNSSAVIQLVA